MKTSIVVQALELIKRKLDQKRNQIPGIMSAEELKK